MKKILLIAALLVASSLAHACTTFFLKDSTGTMLFGRNLDFPTGIGHIHINKRHMAKTAFIFPPEKPLSWVSKYGSITFNQVGRELPYGGMNEAGLVVEQMWLQSTQYPAQDERYGLSELQWIQYQLDCAASVEEVLASDTLVRISTTAKSTLHFLVADSTGDVASIEFLEGQMVVHRGESLPYPALSNSTYARLLHYRKQIRQNPEAEFSEAMHNSGSRFVKAAQMLDQYKSKQPATAYAFATLDSVAQQDPKTHESLTQWSIVYDIASKTIHYRTKANRQIRSIALDNADFSCNSALFYADVHARVNSTDDFLPYSFEANHALIKELVARNEFLNKQLNARAIEFTAKYPETVHCAGE